MGRVDTHREEGRRVMRMDGEEHVRMVHTRHQVKQKRRRPIREFAWCVLARVQIFTVMGWPCAMHLPQPYLGFGRAVQAEQLLRLAMGERRTLRADGAEKVSVHRGLKAHPIGAVRQCAGGGERLQFDKDAQETEGVLELRLGLGRHRLHGRPRDDAAVGRRGRRTEMRAKRRGAGRHNLKRVNLHYCPPLFVFVLLF